MDAVGSVNTGEGCNRHEVPGLPQQPNGGIRDPEDHCDRGALTSQFALSNVP